MMRILMRSLLLPSVTSLTDSPIQSSSPNDRHPPMAIKAGGILDVALKTPCHLPSVNANPTVPASTADAPTLRTTGPANMTTDVHSIGSGLITGEVVSSAWPTEACACCHMTYHTSHPAHRHCWKRWHPVPGARLCQSNSALSKSKKTNRNFPELQTPPSGVTPTGVVANDGGEPPLCLNAGHLRGPHESVRDCNLHQPPLPTSSGCP